MGELRKDYFLDRWVVVSDRVNGSPVLKGDCSFCPGNERSSGELGRVVKGGSWCVRWFEGKSPVFSSDVNSKLSSERFYTSSGGFGYHEVVVDSPRHDVEFANLSVVDMEQVLSVLSRRVVELESRPGVEYVSVFKNQGFLAGAGESHSHCEVVASAFVPKDVKDKVDGMRKFLSCPFCSVIRSEVNSGRRCFENSDFFAFCPFASRFNYEVWVFPKLHLSRFEEVNFGSLANILSSVLKKVSGAGFDYNLVFQNGPKGVDFHFHVEVCPRVSVLGGFDLSTAVNSVSPEVAAKFYRGEN